MAILDALGKRIGALVLALLGAALGLLILFVEVLPPGGNPFTEPENAAFLRKPATRLWVFLGCAQVALMAGLAVPAWKMERSVKGETNRVASALGLLLLAVIVTAFAVVSGYFRPPFDFPGAAVKIGVLTALGGAVCAAPVLVLWRVPEKLEKLRLEGTELPVTAYLRLREHVNRSLLIAGAIIGSAILGAGALRNAVGKEAFPMEFVLIYGIFFSLLLAAVYAPSWVRLQNVGYEIVNQAAPLPDPRLEGWTDAAAKRKELITLLQLELSLTGSLQAGLAILAPLLTSIVSVVLPKE